MGAAARGRRWTRTTSGASEQFALLLPVLGGLLTVLVVVLDGSVATVAGVAFGVGVVLLAGVLSWRETRAPAE